MRRVYSSRLQTIISNNDILATAFLCGSVAAEVRRRIFWPGNQDRIRLLTSAATLKGADAAGNKKSEPSVIRIADEPDQAMSTSLSEAVFSDSRQPLIRINTSLDFVLCLKLAEVRPQ